MIVGIHPGHQAAFEHLGQGADGRFEILETLRRVTVHADQYVSGQAQAEHLAVEQGDLAGNVAVVFQLLDPPRARRRRQADALGQLLVGDACVALQFRQNTQVVTVELAHQTVLCRNYCGGLCILG
ncbi:hypothetical protein D3C78_1450470 [compost metagenome]